MKSEKKNLGIQRRSVTFGRVVDEKERRVSCSFMSEEPYQRSWGLEVLKMAGADLSRVAGGAMPFLVNHNHDDQIGVVEKAWVEGSRGKAVIRFGNGPRASEIWDDITVTGIRKAVSVGYIINEMEYTGDDKRGIETYIVNDFEVLEISSVPVPADASIGIGRSSEFENHKTIIKRGIQHMKKDNNTTSNNKSDTPEQWAPEQKEKHRAGEILALGKAHGFVDQAMEAVNNGTSVNQFRNFVLEGLRAKSPTPIENFVPENIHLGNKQTDFPLGDFIRSQIPGSQVPVPEQVSECRALAKNAGRAVRGTLIPMGSLSRGLTVGTDTAGGHTVATNLLGESFIYGLTNRMMAKRMGATIFDNLSGDVAIPRQTSAATAYYVTENEDVTESQPAFDQVTMTPYTIGARTTISRKALLQSSLDLEQFVREELSRQLALGVDAAAINGTGANGQPEGILNVTGIGSVVGGDNGAAPDHADIINLWSEVAQDNADVGSLGFLTNSKVVGKLMLTEKASNTAQFVCPGLPDKDGMTRLAGMRCGVSNQVPSNLTKGDSSGVCSVILFGNWADLIIGLWGGLDIIVDPYTDSASGKVHVTAFLSFDIALRHAESFAAMKDALTS